MTKPRVSVIIPCLNEAKTIRLLLDALLKQTYPLELVEVIIADALSSDGTREQINRFRSIHPELRCQVVDNPLKTIPSGLNAAIQQSVGEIIIRLDAHSEPDVSYIEKSVMDLMEKKGDNVGGVWKICPGADTWIARSIAVAASNPVGVGDAMYRHAKKAALVDTVPFGAFRKDLFKRVGKFNESLLTNEDYEFNTRIRKQGGKIYLDPNIKSSYIARSNLSALSKQYFRYGYWKWKMLRQYPETIRWRQLLPPLFIFSLLILLIGSTFSHGFFIALVLEILSYGFILMGVILPPSIREKAGWLLVGFPLAVATMHFSWGVGFLLSMFDIRKKRKNYKL